VAVGLQDTNNAREFAAWQDSLRAAESARELWHNTSAVPQGSAQHALIQVNGACPPARKISLAAARRL